MNMTYQYSNFNDIASTRNAQAYNSSRVVSTTRQIHGYILKYFNLLSQLIYYTIV